MLKSFFIVLAIFFIWILGVFGVFGHTLGDFLTTSTNTNIFFVGLAAIAIGTAVYVYTKCAKGNNESKSVYYGTLLAFIVIIFVIYQFIRWYVYAIAHNIG